MTEMNLTFFYSHPSLLCGSGFEKPSSIERKGAQNGVRDRNERVFSSKFQVNRMSPRATQTWVKYPEDQQ